jgi:hypothetical protein
MITQNEISSLNLSPTKKDFVQIWNELIEVASKITERWDPTSTNESDPGIVLLKVLTGIADKLNYNIDKNILEAYMPTAAQMESMRKLCELVGYDIKYYQSAETEVRISYTGNTAEASEERLPDGGLQLPKFTTITNADKDITFVTTNTIPMSITNTTPWITVPCIEGQISQCESTNENNLITLAQLDDNYRYYLPETQIAENGIFVYNALATIDSNGASAIIDGTPWTQVSNLNTQSAETRVFKFGYDSLEGRPYLAFPADVGGLIGDGLFIYFVRTSGLNGNIKERTLEVLELPTSTGWEDYSAEQFEVVNANATTNGANIENISTAYRNFKKTVGTFDTLVTCRDYMNKIYSLMDANNSPYVSNILVTDIRNDINNAITLCSCNEFGILYKEMPLTKSVAAPTLRRDTEPYADPNIWKLFIKQDENNLAEVPLIDHFDLLLYPFKTFTQVSSGTKDLVGPYNKSFTYSEQMNREIETALAELKTCAHNMTTPAAGDIVLINNYLRLNALIATSTKISEIEAESILHNVKVALVNEFNLRNLDFGEEIPFDSILSVIENADSRIKAVSLQEPTILTTYSVKERDGTSKEYGIASTVDTDDQIYDVYYTDEDGNDYQTVKGKTAKDLYNKLVLRNILAGRASLFDYDENFIPNNSEKPYTVTHDLMKSLSDSDDPTAQDRLNAVKAIAEEFINTHRDDETGQPIPGEYLLESADGQHGGVVTLKVFDTEGKEYKVYETYTPNFAEDLRNTDFAKDGIISDITRVKAVCELSSDSDTFENITLGKNEVIKFRAPNLITTKTFPAYVYYRFERDKTTSDSTNTAGTDPAGRYAECISLNSFINKVTKETFFQELWRLAGDRIMTLTASSRGGIGSDTTTLFNTSIAVAPMEEPSKIYTNEDDVRKYLNEKYPNGAENVEFQYYPLLTGTISVWSACVRNCAKKLGIEELPGETALWRLSSTSNYPKGKLVTQGHQRLFAQGGDFLTNVRVDEVTYICTDLGADPAYYSIAEGSDIELRGNDKLYIHYTPSSTNEDGETVNAEPISIVYKSEEDNPIIIKPSGFALMPSDDVVLNQNSSYKKFVDFGDGQNRGLLALAPNEQIELRSISKVVLNTPALFYKNFDDAVLEKGDINNIITYELKDGEYLFYTDKNTQEAAYYGSGSVITLDRGAFIPKAKEHIEVSQILENGLHTIPWSDYVILNDNKKITITEYQYVTLVEGDTLNNLTLALPDPDEKDQSGSQKTTNGGYTINGSSWQKCLSTTENPISYTTANSETATILPKIDLRSGPSTSWEVCSLLELSTSPGYAQQLRAAKTAATDNSPTTSITDKIEVYSKQPNVGERLLATITPKETVMPADNGKETVILEPVSIKLNTIAQTASGTFKKAENTKNTADAVLQMKVFKEKVPSKLNLKTNDDVVTQISSKDSVPIDDSTTSLNNYWTRVDIYSELRHSREQIGTTDPNSRGLPCALSINFMVPEEADLFGIFSIYLEVPDDMLDDNSEQNIPKEGARVFIDIPKEFIPRESGSYQDVISIFNYEKTVKIKDEDGKDTDKSKSFSWWPEGVVTGKDYRLYLRAGLNCIKVAKSCTLLIKAEDSAGGSIIYDNMRLVRGRATNGVNLKLLNPDTTFNAEAAKIADIVAKTTKTDADEAALQAFEKIKVDCAEKVCSQINELDKHHDFYYNVPVENSLAMEFNKNISSFSNPYTLYDINNINNDFVVSKLDVKYLDTGLSIAKSSKLLNFKY